MSHFFVNGCNGIQIAINIQNNFFGNISLVAQQEFTFIGVGLSYYFAYDNGIFHKFFVNESSILHTFSGNNALKQVAGIEALSVVSTEPLALSRSLIPKKEERLFYKLKNDSFTDDERIKYESIIKFCKNIGKKV